MYNVAAVPELLFFSSTRVMLQILIRRNSLPVPKTHNERWTSEVDSPTVTLASICTCRVWTFGSIQIYFCHCFIWKVLYFSDGNNSCLVCLCAVFIGLWTIIFTLYTFVFMYLNALNKIIAYYKSLFLFAHNLHQAGSHASHTQPENQQNVLAC